MRRPPTTPSAVIGKSASGDSLNRERPAARVRTTAEITSETRLAAVETPDDGPLEPHTPPPPPPEEAVSDLPPDKAVADPGSEAPQQPGPTKTWSRQDTIALTLITAV